MKSIPFLSGNVRSSSNRHTIPYIGLWSKVVYYGALKDGTGIEESSALKNITTLAICT